MYRTLVALCILLALAGKHSAASTSGGDINQGLVIKLEALEQKLAAYEQVNQELVSKQAEHGKIIDELVSKQAGHQQIIGDTRKLVPVWRYKLVRYEQINGELSTKQAKYEQMNNALASRLAEAKAIQDTNQQNLQSKLQSLEELWEKQDKEMLKLQLTVEVLQTKLQSTTDECSSMKVQLIKLFSSLSSDKHLQKKQLFTGNNYTTVDAEVEGKSRIFNAHPLSGEEHTEIEKAESEEMSDVDDSDDNPITATLQIDARGGVSYIRWGRTFCEGDADLLYTGFAAGKSKPNDYTGSEPICLHSQPQWGDINTSDRGQSPVTGIEYSFAYDDPFSKENVGGETLDSHNMPCTVCQLETRSHQLMIPGRKSCPSGWTMEYWGYLVNMNHYISGGSYLCLDQAPEGAIGGAAYQKYSPHVYTVEANCLALPCPPYSQGYEISCVVCSK